MAGQSSIGFLHGVASFDPLPKQVIIWTRFTPISATESVSVVWEVSERSDFNDIVASGAYTTDASKDFTVRVDVEGLRPYTRYHYRFSSGKMHSAVGTTKTAPDGPVEGLIFATVCCANWGFGYFHVYDLLARVDDLDFVMHCGDYIYEYKKGYYPSPYFQARHGLRPKHECRTLDDYRQRYACYRTDPGLQELHRKVPMIAVPDDHEVADDANVNGSEDFKGTRAEWQHRKFAAMQAYAEWVPIRGMHAEHLDLAAVHRTFQWGDLLTLMLVENRLSHRKKPIDVEETEFYKLGAQKDMKEWDCEALQRAAEDFKKQLKDSERTMIGAQQLHDVEVAVQESVAAGRPWQVFISQTVFSTIKAPKLLATVDLQPRTLARICRKALGMATDEKRAGKEGAETARMYLAMGKFSVPMNPAAYDGYAAERAKIMKALSIPGSNPVVMAGDSHNAWVHEIVDEHGKRVGVEFDAPAVTAIGAFEDIYSRFKEKLRRLAGLFPLYVFTPWIEDSLVAANPGTLRWCNLNRRGAVVCHVTRTKFHAEYHMVSSVAKRPYKHYCSAVFEAEAGQRGYLTRGFRYLTIDGRIPQREEPKRSAILRSARTIYKQGWS